MFTFEAFVENFLKSRRKLEKGLHFLGAVQIVVEVEQTMYGLRAEDIECAII